VEQRERGVSGSAAARQRGKEEGKGGDPFHEEKPFLLPCVISHNQNMQQLVGESEHTLTSRRVRKFHHSQHHEST
jgi:hypothetical protein